MTYNWTETQFTQLEVQVKRLLTWGEVRQLLLSTILHQKAGLFHQAKATTARKPLFLIDNIDVLLYNSAPRSASASMARSEQVQKRTAGGAEEFHQVLHNRQPRLALYRSAFLTDEDPLLRHGLHYLSAANAIRAQAARDSQLSYLFAKLFESEEMPYSPEIKISQKEISALLSNARLLQCGRTPLLWGLSSLFSDAPSTLLFEHPPIPAALVFGARLAMLKRLYRTYSRYLENIGLRRIKVYESVESDTSTSQQPSQAQQLRMTEQLEKVYYGRKFPGGLVVVEFQIIDDGSCLLTNLFAIENPSISAKRARRRIVDSKDFLDRVCRLQYLLHTNSLVYDFYLSEVPRFVKRCLTATEPRQRPLSPRPMSPSPIAELSSEEMPRVALAVELCHIMRQLSQRDPPSYAQSSIYSQQITPFTLDPGTTDSRFLAFMTRYAAEYGLRSFDELLISPILFHPDMPFKTTFHPTLSTSPFASFASSSLLSSQQQQDQNFLVVVFREQPVADFLRLRLFVIKTRKSLPHYDQPQTHCMQPLAAEAERWYTRTVLRGLYDERSLRLWRVLCDPSQQITATMIGTIPQLLRPKSLIELDPSISILYERNRIHGPSFIDHLHSVYGGDTGLLRHLRSPDPHLHHLLLYSAEAPNRFFLHLMVNNNLNAFEAYSCRRKVHPSDFSRNSQQLASSQEQDDQIERTHISRFITSTSHYIWRTLIFKVPSRLPASGALFEPGDQPSTALD